MPRVRQREVTTLTTRSYRISALLLALVLMIGTTPAFADNVSDKKAQASRVESQIEALDTRAEIATEDYNRASERYVKVTKQVRATSRKLTRIRGKMDKLQGHLYTRADDMYRSGPLGFLEVLLNAKSFDEFNKTWDLLTDLNTRDATTVKELKTVKKESDQTYAELKSAQAAAGKEKRAMARNKKSVLAQLSARKQLLSSINADIRNLIAAQQAAEAAQARRAWLGSSRGGGHTWADAGGDPPSNLSRGLKAVWWAKSRLGAPYVWAAAGPNAFDCSGLTMWAYAKVGVSLSHSSRDQINSGQRVSRANLEPGDLVFFGRSSIHHVGMYVGGGLFIHAPHSGDVVKISSLDSRSDYAGASRP